MVNVKRNIDEKDIHRRYYQEICEKLKHDPYASYLGIKLVEVGEGTAVAEMEVKPHMLNAHGTTHGAILFALADFVFAVACNSYGKTSVALSVNINFLAASIEGASLRATAVEENRTHRTGLYRIQVEGDGKTLALLDALAYRKSDYFIDVNLNPQE
ncbi:hotdog fold thioesterase [Aneurinibacillus sp. REN35]|uniref:hotdog fold thioesterase n=1 Tax=Aneurinibacillus sp. REN35 TaxID=3237286 RepID=UPI0035272B3A